MRLDKYLKVSRLIKRRTLANDVADAGRVMSSRSPSATAPSRCGCFLLMNPKARMLPASCLRSWKAELQKTGKREF